MCSFNHVWEVSPRIKGNHPKLRWYCYAAHLRRDMWMITCHIAGLGFKDFRSSKATSTLLPWWSKRHWPVSTSRAYITSSWCEGCSPPAVLVPNCRHAGCPYRHAWGNAFCTSIIDGRGGTSTLTNLWMSIISRPLGESSFRYWIRVASTGNGCWGFPHGHSCDEAGILCPQCTSENKPLALGPAERAFLPMNPRGSLASTTSRATSWTLALTLESVDLLLETWTIGV